MENLREKFMEFLKKHEFFRNCEIKPAHPADLICAQNFSLSMFLNTPEDYLLHFASLILLSANNKINQKSDAINYSFKMCVGQAIDAAIEANEKYIFFKTIKDDKNVSVTYVEILGIQFSFHNVPETDLMKWAVKNNRPQYKSDIVWQRIPMQKGAQKLFEFCLELPNVSKNIFYDEKTPKEIVENARREYIKRLPEGDEISD